MHRFGLTSSTDLFRVNLTISHITLSNLSTPPKATLYVVDPITATINTVQIPNPRRITPGSTPTKRAATLTCPLNGELQYTRVPLSRGPGEEHRVLLGVGPAFIMMKDDAMKGDKSVQRQLAAMEERVDAKIASAVGEVKRDYLKRFDDLARHNAKESEPIVLFALICLINDKVVGIKPGEQDDESCHITKLLKYTRKRTGLIKTDAAVRAMFTTDNVEILVNMVDVKRRHHLAHPNLTEPDLFKKIFLLQRAYQEVGTGQERARMDLVTRMYLSLINPRVCREFVDKWRADGEQRWDRLDMDQIVGFYPSYI